MPPALELPLDRVRPAVRTLLAARRQYDRETLLAEAVRANLSGLMTASDKVRAEGGKLAAHYGIQEIGPALRERGLIFVGIDVIGDYLTEINVKAVEFVSDASGIVTKGARPNFKSRRARARLRRDSRMSRGEFVMTVG